MPRWFKKVFSGDAGKAPVAESPTPEPSVRPVAKPSTVDEPALGKPDTAAYEQRPKVRKIVNAPVLVPDEERSAWSEEIRIKARVEKDGYHCVFLVDRPVLEGLSAWFPEAVWAAETSPLAEQLFAITGVGTVLLHDMTVTIGLADGATRPWEDLAAEVGSAIRAHLKSGEPVVVNAFREQMPPEEEIQRKIQAVIDLEINPGIAAHSGSVHLERVHGNTIYITMGGGCQGCAASAITLRQGIHTAFRRAAPEVGAILDETDHTAGRNPYFKELPAGMA
jgi:NFU1 iron-sulfur cluster scaffold homolog, mitochondrial